MHAYIEISESVIYFGGSWTLHCLEKVNQPFDKIAAHSAGKLTADGSRIDNIDTAGAWRLKKIIRCFVEQRVEVTSRSFSPEHQAILDMVKSDAVQVPQTHKKTFSDVLSAIGLQTYRRFYQVQGIVAFLGETFFVLINLLTHPRKLRWRPILHNLQAAGFRALPITGLLAFLMGVVIAYQSAEQLRRYGANIYVVDLIGLTMLREIAPLLTAIIAAGRSGSAYAAQIGTMKVTEEIDTLRTIGIAPMELLVIPKLLAMMIALPLLTVYADILGVAGGMMMAKIQLGVGMEDFIDRFGNSIKLASYLTGVGKVPVFAVIIVIVGCFQGYQARGGADSVGRQTTMSVVQAIFWVIIADAIFSVAFSILKI
jgi:phospholipid/cholesterol/gamma-HCH transport system permease protein